MFRTSPCLRILAASTAIALVLPACRESDAAPGASAERDDSIIEITARGFTFEAPDEVPSGWLTYRLNNESGHEIHEVSITRLPEGRSYEEYMDEAIPVWVEVWERIQSGELDAAGSYAYAAEHLPEWADRVQYLRARGLVSPGRSTRNTHYLEPGSYLIECWVKSASGHIHLQLGMTRPLTVTEARSEHAPPAPDIMVTLTDSEILVEGELRPGDRTIGFRAESDEAPDNVHLVRMQPETDPAAVARWMDWYSIGGLQAPAPADFLGGVHLYGSELPEGRAYFGVEDVQPGRYAWIVEGPDGEQPGLWSVFTVE